MPPELPSNQPVNVPPDVPPEPGLSEADQPRKPTQPPIGAKSIKLTSSERPAAGGDPAASPSCTVTKPTAKHPIGAKSIKLTSSERPAAAGGDPAASRTTTTESEPDKCAAVTEKQLDTDKHPEATTTKPTAKDSEAGSGEGCSNGSDSEKDASSSSSSSGGDSDSSSEDEADDDDHSAHDPADAPFFVINDEGFDRIKARLLGGETSVPSFIGMCPHRRQTDCDCERLDNVLRDGEVVRIHPRTGKVKRVIRASELLNLLYI